MAFHYTDLMEYLLMQIGLCGPEGRSFFFSCGLFSCTILNFESIHPVTISGHVASIPRH